MASLPPPWAEDGNQGNRKITCPLYGCKRIHTDPAALERHIKEHEIPAQSVPGKTLVCSAVGCSTSLPDMQKLMGHVRRHHKLNIFFQCENCRTKLRSYRGLLTHLHTCSKVARGRPKPAEPTAASPAVSAPTSSVTTPTAPPTVKEQQCPQLESTSAPALDAFLSADNQGDSSLSHLSPLHLTDMIMHEGQDPPPLN